MQWPVTSAFRAYSKDSPTPTKPSSDGTGGCPHLSALKADSDLKLAMGFKVSVYPNNSSISLGFHSRLLRLIF